MLAPENDDDPRAFVPDDEDNPHIGDGNHDDDDDDDDDDDGEEDDEDEADTEDDDEEDEEELLMPHARRRGAGGAGAMSARGIERQVMQAIQQVMMNQRAAAAPSSSSAQSSSPAAAASAAPAGSSAPGVSGPLVDLISSLLSGPQGAALQRMFGFAGNLGDYAIGDNFQEVVDRLYRESTANPATKPASAAAIEALERVTLTAADVVEANGDKVTCAVCKDELEGGDTAVRLQCKHLYHPDCIVQWLKTSGTCPVCRAELPKEEAPAATAATAATQK
jgi:hypothetical protein